ncbi:MAG: hypothetical protein WC426_13670 [Sulfuriferula sp.]
MKEPGLENVRKKMEKVVIAFDIDGTLRCNCTATCQDRNEPYCQLVEIFARHFKNVRVIAWSGGGKPYCETQVRMLGLSEFIPPERCHAKLNYYMKNGQVPIAVDDIQDTALGIFSLIVRAK